MIWWEAGLVEVFITGAYGADGQGSQSVLGRTVGETIGGRAIVPQEGVINDVAWEQHPVVFVEQCDARRRVPR